MKPAQVFNTTTELGPEGATSGAECGQVTLLVDLEPKWERAGKKSQKVKRNEVGGGKAERIDKSYGGEVKEQTQRASAKGECRQKLSLW